MFHGRIPDGPAVIIAGGSDLVEFVAARIAAAPDAARRT
jgi:hypothetical protein